MSGTARRAARRGAHDDGEHASPADGGRMDTLLRELTELHQRVERLESQLQDRSAKLGDVSKRLTRLERRIERASASFPVRTALSLRRRLHRMLK